jgi:hypothetical protein
MYVPTSGFPGTYLTYAIPNPDASLGLALPFDACRVGHQNFASSSEKLTDHSEFPCGVIGCHRRHVVAEGAEDRGQNLIQAAVRLAGDQNPAPVIWIADALGVSSLDEPVDNPGHSAGSQAGEACQFTSRHRAAREQVKALSIGGTYAQAPADKFVEDDDGGDEITAEQASFCCVRCR